MLHLVCTSIPTALPDGTGKEDWEWVDMLWYQGAQNIGLSNRKLNSAPKCTAWLQCTPVPDRQTDGQTNEHHDNSVMIRSNERIAR